MKNEEIVKIVRKELIEQSVKEKINASPLNEAGTREIETDKTIPGRPSAMDTRIKNDTGERRPVSSSDLRHSKPSLSKGYVDDSGSPTEKGRAVLEAHNIVNKNIAQMLNFEKGKQLGKLLSKRIEKKTGMPAKQIYPIVMGVIKETIRQLDEEIEAEMREHYQELFNTIKS